MTADLPHPILCMIPARGGSQRIPKKNIVRVGGLPLIVHSINDAKEARSIDRVVVTTDDPAIADVARTAGAEVVMRPAELADEYSHAEPALQHALAGLEDSGYRPKLIVLLQCTSPIRTGQDIDRAVDVLVQEAADSVVSACRNVRFFWRRTKEGAQPINYDYRRRCREQDHPEEYEENGSIYVFTPEILRRENNRLGGKIAIYEMGHWSRLQIDTPEDVALCDWYFSR